MKNPAGAPLKIIHFKPIWIEGKYHHPEFSNQTTLYLLKKKTPKSVSFRRAYMGWRTSGAREEKELGEGRAFIRWLQKYQLSIEWGLKDYEVNPLLNHPEAPRHDPEDEMGQGLSFAIRPVKVEKRVIKLYVRDEDILSLISMKYGDEEDFLSLIKAYLSYRIKWEKWRAPTSTFLDWVKAQGKRPVLAPGQIGFLIA